MAQITMTFQDAVGTGTTQVTLSNADMDRIVTAYREMHKQPNGNPATKAQAIKQMSKTALAVWKNQTRSHEQNKAIVALPPVPDIPITEVP